MTTAERPATDRLQQQLRHALDRSPYYRRVAGSRRGRHDTAPVVLADLPLTTAEDVAAAGPLGFAAVEYPRIARYAESRDHAGRPLGAAATTGDLRRTTAAMAEALRAHAGPADLAFVAVPYELSGGAQDTDRALAAVGAGVVGVGALSPVCPPERTAELVAALRPSLLATTPDRALATHARLTAAGHVPRALGQRVHLYLGGPCSPVRAARVAELWGATAAWAYGSTLTPAAGLPCAAGTAHLTAALYHAEVIDPDGTDPVPDGGCGELVLTTLAAEATPLLRYRTGDLVRPARCGCGDPRPALQQHGRVEDRWRPPSGAPRTAVELEQAVLSVPGTGLYCATGWSAGRPTAVLDEATGGTRSEAARALRALTGIAWQVTAADRTAFLTATTRAGRRRLRPADLEAL
ncbi:phenylacetate--CoA ligase family protein [Streptomyces lonarensis]|uniref:Phenylacetate--CoA ligase family protein n=2 Tax=Streptomyces lonarensis TaxID=700599 RepID=A0A7X6D070_9ACTN|nr:phenylacetate--CoA ligase family protein [Streptomyces lonarensis]NJQ05674.1 phenylacetate--CoA ligase family protein [Streptomyces lonarensis]